MPNNINLILYIIIIYVTLRSFHCFFFLVVNDILLKTKKPYWYLIPWWCFVTVIYAIFSAMFLQYRSFFHAFYLIGWAPKWFMPPYFLRYCIWLQLSTHLINTDIHEVNPLERFTAFTSPEKRITFHLQMLWIEIDFFNDPKTYTG
jgi:hypothetical protein